MQLNWAVKIAVNGTFTLLERDGARTNEDGKEEYAVEFDELVLD